MFFSSTLLHILLYSIAEQMYIFKLLLKQQNIYRHTDFVLQSGKKKIFLLCSKQKIIIILKSHFICIFQVECVAQELKMTVIRGREQRDKLLLEVDRLKQVSTTWSASAVLRSRSVLDRLRIRVFFAGSGSSSYKSSKSSLSTIKIFF